MACLAAEALGPAQVRGVSLPSQFSSPGSLEDARLLAERLGIRYDIIPIQPPFEAVKNQLQGLFAGRPPDMTRSALASCSAPRWTRAVG